MRKANFTPFGIEVKKALIDRGWSYTDLSEEVRKKTGLHCDSPYISRILTGVRSPDKITNAISEILGLKGADEYAKVEKERA